MHGMNMNLLDNERPWETTSRPLRVHWVMTAEGLEMRWLAGPVAAPSAPERAPISQTQTEAA
jgi:hypothetical protein